MLDLAGRRFKHSSSRRSICKLPSNQFSCFVERISRLFQFAYTDAFVVILTTQIVWVSKCFRCSTFLTRKSQGVLVSQFRFLRSTHRLLRAWVAQSACYGRISPGCHKPASLPHSSTETKPCGNPHPPPIPTKSSLAPICSWPNPSVLLKATFLTEKNHCCADCPPIPPPQPICWEMQEKEGRRMRNKLRAIRGEEQEGHQGIWCS